MNNRIKWIDTAKGVGIILVVLGHTFMPSLAEKIVYSFHMPLFFLLAGCVAKSDVSIDLLIRKRIKSLIVPFLFFGTVSYMFWFVSNRVVGYTSSDDPLKAFLSLFIPVGKEYYVIGALWFLPCLFVVELVFLVFNKPVIHRFAKIPLVVVSSVIGVYYLPVVHFRLPLFIDVGFSGIVFYAIGYIYCKYSKAGLVLDKRAVYIIPVLMTVHLIAAFINCKPSMAGLKFGNIGLFYLGAISGIGWVVMCCRKLCSNRYLIYLGQNTLVILGLHIIIFNVIDATAKLLFHIKYIDLQGSLIAGIVYTSIIINLLIPVIFVVNRFIPWIAGKRLVAQ